jgi:hypothetical protein
MTPESTGESLARRSGLPWFRFLWALALVASLVISAYAAFRGGYVGPDYNNHLARMLDRTRLFDFSTADPPIYILIGHGLFRLIGRNNGFPITLAIVQAAINALAMWWFFLYTERRFKSPVLHLALVLFLTFLPVRVIHSVTSGTDWLTIPAFMLVLVFFDRFRSEETSTAKNAALVGLALALGIWSKYSFMALLPAIFVIFVILWWKRSWSLMRFVAICALSLVLPSGLVLHDFWQSSRLPNATARTVWIPKAGAPGQPEMVWKDLFLVKKSDLALFKAPQFFKREPEDGNNYHIGYRAAHRHSYLALSHMMAFTDTQNLFQDLPIPQSVDRYLIPDFKTRPEWKTPWNVASVSFGAFWTLLALIGTPWILLGAIKHLWKNNLEREDVVAFLGTAYFLLLFLAVPYCMWSARDGAWTTRLILVPLIYFFLAGFLLLDRTIVTKWQKMAFVILALALVQCGIEIVVLT